MNTSDPKKYFNPLIVIFLIYVIFFILFLTSASLSYYLKDNKSAFLFFNAVCCPILIVFTFFSLGKKILKLKSELYEIKTLDNNKILIGRINLKDLWLLNCSLQIIELNIFDAEITEIVDLSKEKGSNKIQIVFSNQYYFFEEANNPENYGQLKSFFARLQ